MLLDMNYVENHLILNNILINTILRRPYKILVYGRTWFIRIFQYGEAVGIIATLFVIFYFNMKHLHMLFICAREKY